MKTDIRTLADLISRRGQDALAAEFEAALTPLAEAIERDEFPIAPRSAINEAELLEALTELSKVARPASWAEYRRELKLNCADISLPAGTSAEHWRDHVWEKIDCPMHAGYDWASSAPISGGEFFSEFLYQWFFRGWRDDSEMKSKMTEGFEDAFDRGLPIAAWIEKCAPAHIASMWIGRREYWHCLRATALYLGFFAIAGDAAAAATLAKIARLLPGLVVLGSDECGYMHVTCDGTA